MHRLRTRSTDRPRRPALAPVAFVPAPDFVFGLRGLLAIAVTVGALALPDASPGASVVAVPAVARACHVTVYANDPDPAGTHLRDGPARTFRIVATQRDDDAQYDVTGAVGRWLRVARVRGADGSVRFSGEGWVFGPLTAVRAQRRVALRAAPADDAAPAGTMAADGAGAVEGCDDAWVHVHAGTVDGWIAPGQHCGNPVSGCV